MEGFFYANVTGNDNKGGINKMLAINVIIQSTILLYATASYELERGTATWCSKWAVARLQWCVPRFETV